MNQQDNPYASPESFDDSDVPSELFFETPLAFNGEVSERDFISASRRSIALAIFCFASVLIALFLMGTVLHAIRGGPVQRSLMFLFTVLLISLGLSIWRVSGFGWAKRQIRMFPSSVGPVTGRFIADRLESQAQDGVTDVLSLAAITGVYSSHDAIRITTDRMRIASTLFPRHLFSNEDFYSLRSRLDPIEKRTALHRPTAIVDSRLVEEDFRLEKETTPDTAIEFAGNVLSRDLRRTPHMARAIRISITSLFPSTLLLCLYAVGCYGMLGTTESGIVYVMILIGIPTWRLLRVARYFRSLARAPDRIVMKCRGWVDAEHVMFESTISRCHLGMQKFERCSISDDAILLTLPGTFPQSVFLTRRSFADAAAWERVTERVTKAIDASRIVRI